MNSDAVTALVELVEALLERLPPWLVDAELEALQDAATRAVELEAELVFAVAEPLEAAA